MSDTEEGLVRLRKWIKSDVPLVYERFLISGAAGFRGERLLLYEVDEVVERNSTFEVQAYVPEFLAVGDDSGRLGVIRWMDALAALPWWMAGRWAQICRLRFCDRLRPRGRIGKCGVSDLRSNQSCL